MKKSDTTYILGVVFAAATSVFYCCVRWFHIQLPRYYPLERTWKWAKEPGVPSQGWYAMQTFAFVCGAVITLAVYLVIRYTCSEQSELDPRDARRLGAAGAILIVACMAYILFYELGKWGIIGA